MATKPMVKNKFFTPNQGFIAISLIIIVLLILYIGYLYAKKSPAIPQSSPAPTLYYLEGEKPFIQIIFDWSIAEYFNIYRAAAAGGPWIKIIENFPSAAHTAVDYHFPKNSKTLYYRVVPIGKDGLENPTLPAASIQIP